MFMIKTSLEGKSQEALISGPLTECMAVTLREEVLKLGRMTTSNDTTCQQHRGKCGRQITTLKRRRQDV